MNHPCQEFCPGAFLKEHGISTLAARALPGPPFLLNFSPGLRFPAPALQRQQPPRGAGRGVRAQRVPARGTELTERPQGRAQLPELHSPAKLPLSRVGPHGAEGSPEPPMLSTALSPGHRLRLGASSCTGAPTGADRGELQGVTAGASSLCYHQAHPTPIRADGSPGWREWGVLAGWKQEAAD